MSTVDMQIPFGDLRRHYRMHKAELDAAINSVLNSGWFILGECGENFERAFANYCNVQYAVGVGSGTEAIQVALMAAGVGKGDEVVTVTNTCVPTIVGIVSAGARPVLTDVDESSFTMSPESLEAKITSKTRAIVPVHLYGQSADINAISRIAKKHNLIIVEDAAQAHGTRFGDRRIGSISLLTAFSFYPSKNLGSFGDGGCVTTDDAELAAALKMLRNYGQRERYYHSIFGINSRLDEIQAAILLSKLKHLDAWNERRRAIAGMYDEGINNASVRKPKEMEYGFHVWHLYVVRVKDRAHFQQFLRERGISTMIHYPIPIHLQEAYSWLGYRKGEFPIAEKLANEIVSLPIYPEMTDNEVRYVCDAVNEFRPGQ